MYLLGESTIYHVIDITELGLMINSYCWLLPMSYLVKNSHIHDCMQSGVGSLSIVVRVKIRKA